MNFASAWESFPTELETLAIRESSKPDNFASKCVVTPIVTSSNFILRGSGTIGLENGGATESSEEVFEYARGSNPTRSHLEKYFASLEGSKHALAFGSGVAAIGAVVLTLGQGDHIVSSMALYGGTTSIMREVKRYGVTVDFFETTETDEIIKMIKPNTKMILFETPSNPTLRIYDINEISTKTHAIREDIMVVVDNTFLTPVLQRCLKLGADLVVYSTSKYIGGHADVVGGMVCMNNQDLFEKVRHNQEVWGGIPSSFDCYLTIRSLKTLHLRLQKHSENSLKVAKFLESHNLVDKVVHPGLKSHPQHQIALKQQEGHSGMLGFYIKGGLKEAAKFMNSVNIIRKATSLGADISLVTIPARMSHIQLSQEERNRLGILDNYIRLSVGLEGAQDLIKDLDQALKKSVS